MLRNPLALVSALTFVLAPFMPACGGDDDDDDNVDAGEADAQPSACGEIEGRCVELSPSDDDQEAVQTALIDAESGDVIFLHAGTYRFQTGLSLTVENVTLRGEGEDQTILSFDDASGAEGLLVTADGFTAELLAVEDTPGDAIKVEGAARVVFRHVRTEWTGKATAANGDYGLYPVQCSDILIEDSIVIGAADAGIYVGQSARAVVRRNRVERNVAGIEIENTTGADVYDNVATGNTGGILVFNLPDLPVGTGAETRVFNNQIIANNGDNFATPGTTVSTVPPGTGLIALAAHRVEVFGNTFEDNRTNQVGIISYFIVDQTIEDMTYDPFPDTLDFHDNTFVGGGDMPAGFGLVIRAVLDKRFGEKAPAALPDIAFDHILPDDLKLEDPRVDPKAGEYRPEFNICLRNNKGADFVSLDAFNEFAGLSLDASPHDCAHDPLPAVELEGVAL